MFFKPGNIWPQFEWPGFVYFVTSLVNSIFGFTPFIVRFSNIIFLALLAIFTYLIGKRCYDIKAGLLAAFLVTFYPSLFGVGRMYDLDFHLTAMVTMCVYFLIKTTDFKNRLFSIILGISSGLGILTKGQFLIFFIGPLTFALYSIFKDRNQNGGNIRRQVFNFVLFIFFCLFISSIWLFASTVKLSHIFLTHFLAGYLPEKYNLFGLDFDVFSVKWMFYQLFYIIDHVSLPLYIVFCFSLFWLHKKIEPVINIILLWILIPLVIFTLMSAKWEHYCFAFLPAIAILTAVGVMKLGRQIKIPLILFIIVYSLLQFFAVSYRIGPKIVKLVAFYNVVPLPEWGRTGLYKAPIKINNYEKIIQGFAEKIKKDVSSKRKILVGIIGTKDEEINGFLASYYLRAYLDNSEAFILADDLSSMPNAKSMAKRFIEKIGEFNFMILINSSLKDGSAPVITNCLLEGQLLKKLSDNINKRKLIQRHKLFPGHRNIFLFR
ncbi:MAG: glycosyltransferase family 39 protein [Candidatus Omnitrophica bacterium]|nr:glycosyltransferase family 39 protein [Candidatus Omnitrophota bacterium]